MIICRFIEALYFSGESSSFFFFSSRRRHTRFKCDWSSDVCSSDLPRLPGNESQSKLLSVWRPIEVRISRARSGELLYAAIAMMRLPQSARRGQAAARSGWQYGAAQPVSQSLRRSINRCMMRIDGVRMGRNTDLEIIAKHVLEGESGSATGHAYNHRSSARAALPR